MFSAGDRAQQTEIAEALETGGFDTFLPHRDGIEVRKSMEALRRQSAEMANAPGLREFLLWGHRLVFAFDVYQVVERCDALVFNMDGAVPDAGGVAEAALAFLAGKPVVLFKTTAITMLAGFDNPLVMGLAGWEEPVEKPEALAVRVERVLEGVPRRSVLSRKQIRPTVDAGELVWQLVRPGGGPEIGVKRSQEAIVNTLSPGLGRKERGTAVNAVGLVLASRADELDVAADAALDEQIAPPWPLNSPNADAGWGISIDDLLGPLRE
jgi:nucleoside 2-deoxyribosyltransferase